MGSFFWSKTLKWLLLADINNLKMLHFFPFLLRAALVHLPSCTPSLSFVPKIVLMGSLAMREVNIPRDMGSFFWLKTLKWLPVADINNGKMLHFFPFLLMLQA